MASSITITVNNDKSGNERQSFKNTRKTTTYMLRFVLKEKHGKTYAALVFLSSLLNVLPAIVYTMFPGMIINELTGERRIYILIFYICILILTPVVYQIINRFIRRKIENINLMLSAVFSKKYDYHTAMMDFETIEEPDIQTMSNRVFGTFFNATRIIDRLGSLISAIFSLIAIFSIIATINIFIIFIVLIVILVNSIITKHLNQKQFLNNKEISKFDRYSSNLSIVLHYISYAKEVRLFNLKSYFADMLFKKRMETNEIHLKNTTNNLNAQILFSLTNLLQQAILYVYLIYRVIYTGLPIGSMSIYMAAVGQIAGAFNNIINGYLELSKDSLDIQEMISFMNIPLKQYATGDRTPRFDAESVIEFRNVSFKYPGSDKYALHNMNIIFRGDEKLCIVGINGSGKSTFIKLLTRLYFPTEGEILLNGVNINEYDYTQYQRLFTPVFQDFQLYSLSLAENIILADEYDEARLDEVCLKCGLSELIKKLSRGYETSVFKVFDEEGFDPSGGEGQRIAIARAIYHGGSVFLLDEPTAALDPLAEYEIYAQFNEMITDKAAILITHRLSAVQLADKIAVFDKGELIEYGTHKELYDNGGLYKEMFDRQSEFYKHQL